MAENSRLILAIVQSQDVELVETALRDINVTIHRLPSVGGFLGRKNVSILIKINDGNKNQIVEILKKTCQQRIEYIAIPLESTALPIPTPTPITIGGGILFDIDIERYEEF